MKWLLTDNPEITTLTFASTSVRKLFKLKKRSSRTNSRHLSTVLGKQPTGITFFLLLSEKSQGNIVSQHKRSLRKLIDTGHCCQAGILIVFFGRNLFKQLSLVRHRLDVIQNNDFPSQNQFMRLQKRYFKVQLVQSSRKEVVKIGRAHV